MTEILTVLEQLCRGMASSDLVEMLHTRQSTRGAALSEYMLEVVRQELLRRLDAKGAG